MPLHSTKPNEFQRDIDRKRGKPAFFLLTFTRLKKPENACSIFAKVQCDKFAGNAPYPFGSSPRISVKDLRCSCPLIDFACFFQASIRSCSAALYSRRCPSRIRSNTRYCARVGCKPYWKVKNTGIPPQLRLRT